MESSIFVPAYDHANLVKRLGNIDFSKITALDLGCGAYESDVARQIATLPFQELYSVEAWPQDFDRIGLVSAKRHTKVLDDILSFVIKNAHDFDITFMIDALEHLERKDGEVVLKLLEQFSRKIVLFVPEEPVGFHRKPQGDNPLQAHASHWREQDFTSRGYKVERIKEAHSDMIEPGKYQIFDALWCIKEL